MLLQAMNVTVRASRRRYAGAHPTGSTSPIPFSSSSQMSAVATKSPSGPSTTQSSSGRYGQLLITAAKLSVVIFERRHQVDFLLQNAGSQGLPRGRLTEPVDYLGRQLRSGRIHHKRQVIG